MKHILRNPAVQQGNQSRSVPSADDYSRYSAHNEAVNLHLDTRLKMQGPVIHGIPSTCKEIAVHLRDRSCSVKMRHTVLHYKYCLDLECGPPQALKDFVRVNIYVLDKSLG